VLEQTLIWNYRDIDSLLDVQHGLKYLQKLTFDDFENYDAVNIEYLTNENYIFKLNNLGDSIIVFDENAIGLNIENNELIITGVYKSTVETTGEQIDIVCQIFDNDIFIEESVETISSIPMSLKYWEKTLVFENQISSTNKLVVYIKLTDTQAVLLNNIVVKYLD